MQIGGLVFGAGWLPIGRLGNPIRVQESGSQIETQDDGEEREKAQDPCHDRIVDRKARDEEKTGNPEPEEFGGEGTWWVIGGVPACEEGVRID
jgi:hypothetical protein